MAHLWLNVICVLSIFAAQEALAQRPNLPRDVLDLVRDIKVLKGMLRGVYIPRSSINGFLDGDEVITSRQTLRAIKDYYKSIAFTQGRKKRSAEDEVVHREKRGIMNFNNDFLATGKWPSGEIFYAINQTLTADQKAVIDQAISWWTSKTCLRFTEVFQANNPTNPYVLFTAGASCVSFVGRTIENVPQPTYLDAFCFQLVGRIAHEIGHSGGLWHTHQLSTRNDHINVYPGNMVVQNDGEIVDLPPSLINYYNLPYDFSSLMHFGPTAFALPGRTTIESRDPLFQQTFGQRVEVSFNDAKLINLEYCSGPCRNIRISCQNGGYQDYSNCARCICPDGWTGPLCADVDSRRCGGDIIVDGLGGSISSPGFDQFQQYPENTMCAWRLRNLLNQNIVFEFDNRFGIFCFGNTAFHWVELRINGTLHDTGYRFCGTQKPNNVFVSVNPSKEVMVVFKSNFNSPNTFTRTGFKLQYRLENQVGCMVGGCQNGGTCNRADGACQCAQGFKGFMCEVDDRCNQGYCRNGATCTVRSSSAPLCSCRPGFTGPRCQNADPGTPTPSPPTGDCGACGLPAGKTQIACNSTTETQEYEVRCSSLDPGRYRFFGGRGGRSRWCTAELSTKYCCDNAELMRVNDDFLCGVPGWSDWGPCSGKTCGGCGVRRKSLYQISRRFSYRSCYNDRMTICGVEKTGCNFNPCPADQCNGNTQVRDDSREDDDHHGFLWGIRKQGGVLDLFSGGGRGRGGRQRQNSGCQNQCCLPYRLSSDGSTCSNGNDNPQDPVQRNPVTPSTTPGTTTLRNIEPIILADTTLPDRFNGGWTPSTRRQRRTTTLPPWLRDP